MSGRGKYEDDEDRIKKALGSLELSSFKPM